jgi:hypothetical protein
MNVWSYTCAPQYASMDSLLNEVQEIFTYLLIRTYPISTIII